jgi:HK97 family phage portal protein
VTELRRASGLLVPSSRSLGPPDELPPRDNPPNDNPPAGTVGPGPIVPPDYDSLGFGGTHAMYPASDPPIEAQAWAGWPVGWQVPSSWNIGPRWQGGGSDIVFAAIDKNAAAIGDMPVVTTKALVAQPARSWLVNPQPECYSSWAEFARQVWWSYQGCGEAFVIATSRFADTLPRSFMLVDPWLINAEIQDGVRRYTIGDEDVTADVVHIRYTSWPGDARGHGPLEVAGARIEAARTLMQYSSDLASNGGIPWAILKSKYRMTDDQANRLKLQWISAARARMGVPAILDADLDLVPLQYTPADMALSQLQTAAEARLSVLLGVPPYMLGLPSAEGSSAPYQNVVNLFDYWWRSTLHPHGSFIMRALSGWALPWGTELVLDATSYTQPTPFERAQYYDVMARLGAITVDEIRAAERLGPLGEIPALPTIQQGVTTNVDGH